MKDRYFDLADTFFDLCMKSAMDRYEDAFFFESVANNETVSFDSRILAAERALENRSKASEFLSFAKGIYKS